MAIVTGTQGNDFGLSGTSGSDEIYGLGGTDSIFGYDGIDFIWGGTGNDTISGGAGADIIQGDPGDDSINGGTGSDTLFGGNGEDYLSGGDHTDFLYGDSGDDRLFGGDASDWLYGGTGNDELHGGLGNDIIEGNDDDDELYGWAGDDNLRGGAGNDILDGEYGNNILDGGSGDDLLIGSAGRDTLDGDTGTDTARLTFYISYYQVIRRFDLEAADGSGATYYDFITGGGSQQDKRLIAIEHVEFTYNPGVLEDIDALDRVDMTVNGEIFLTAGDDAFVATTGSETIYGGDGDDDISAREGDDTLDGGAGSDDLRGGAGNDRYYVDEIGDAVIENAGEGIGDYIFSTVSYTIAENVERLYLEGTADINATGRNGTSDILVGNAGNNVLDGQSGADVMQGGLGNDQYFVDQSNDVVGENAAEGTDLIFTTSSYQIAENAERLIAVEGATGAVGLTARNNQNDIVIGNSGTNVFIDQFGRDTFIGGGGADFFRFIANLDGVNNVNRINDFDATDDQFQLQQTIYSQISVGILDASEFVLGTAAGDADDRIIYDSTVGKAYYDPDGTGVAAQIEIVNVAIGTAIAADDFQIF